MKKSTVFVILFTIIALGGFLRAWQIDSVPPGIYPDEALNATQGLNAWQTKDFKLFYPDNNGREGLYINLIGISFGLFGVSIVSFKIVSVIIGTLTILGQYLLTTEFFLNLSWNMKKAQLVGLLSSFFLALSFWHFLFSRMSFRLIFTPLILAFSFWLLLRGFRQKNIWNVLVAGLIFGLGFHTYISFRLAVLVIAFLAVAWLLVAVLQKWKMQYLKLGSAFAVGVVIAALPMILFFTEHPEYFVSRATGISVFAQEQPIQSFVKSLGQHMAMFNFAGDGNWRHNYSGAPQLTGYVGVMFLIGIAYVLVKLLQEIIQTFKKHEGKSVN